MEDRIETLSRHVRRLERQLRWQRAGLLLLVLAGSVRLLPSGFADPTAPAEVRARSFALLSDEGAPLALLGASQDGAPRLSLFGRDGGPRVTLALDADGAPSLSLNGASGRKRIVLEATAEENRISVFGLGRTAVTLANGAGSPRLAVADGKGNDRVWLAVRLGSPVLQFLDEKGIARTGLTTFNTDTGLAVMSDTDRSRPGLVLYGRDRTIVWSAP